MRKIAIVLLAICAVASAAEKTLEELKIRAEKASGGEQAKLYAEIADLLVGEADREFSSGASVQAHATMQQIVENASKARDVAIATRNKRKEVEILLRNAQRHLESVKHTLAQVDRAPVDEIEKKLADLRQDLLDSMFAAKPK